MRGQCSLCWLFGLRHPRIGATCWVGPGPRGLMSRDCNPISDEVTAFYSWFLVCTRPYVHPPRVESQFPQSYGNSAIKTPLTLQRQIHRPPPIVRLPSWGPWHGLRIFIPGERTGQGLFSSLWSPTWHVWDLDFIRLWNFHHLIVAPSLSLDVGYFLIGPSIFLLAFVPQQQLVDFGVSVRRGELTSFYSTIFLLFLLCYSPKNSL